VALMVGRADAVDGEQCRPEAKTVKFINGLNDIIGENKPQLLQRLRFQPPSGTR
jgi:hypothetical protein